MQVSFGYTSILKTHWKNGLMPTVTKGLYGDDLTQENVSLEHIKPHSLSGSTDLYNLALASRKKNLKRKNRPLYEVLNFEQARKYLSQFEGIDLPDFNGNAYAYFTGERIRRCLNENPKKILNLKA